MADQIIPCSTTLPHYKLGPIALDGVNYVLQFDWNDRAQRWYFSLLDSTESVIAAGLCVLVNVPMLMAVTDSRRPPGDFMAIDTSGQSLEAGLSDLGGRVQFRYMTYADLKAAGVAQ